MSLDYEEMVDLVAITEAARRPDGANLAGRIATLPIHGAIRMVVEEWSDEPVKQLSALIVRQAGPPIRSFNAIRSLYERRDFPRAP